MSRIRKLLVLALLLTPYSFLLTPLLAPAPAQASTTGVSVYGPSTLYSGLTAWWNMDGKNTNWATGQTYDSSGNNNTGQLVNLSTTTSPAQGLIGQALSFTGAMAVKDTSGLSSIRSGDMTLSGWFYFNTISGSQWLINQWSLSAGPALFTNSGNLYWEIGGASGQHIIVSSPFSTNKWFHVVAVDSGGNLSLYINSVLRAGPTAMTITYDTSNSFRIGSEITAGGVGPFYGKADDVRVYNRALSAQEVAELYRTGLGQRSVSPVGPANLNSGLVGWWTFDGKNTNWATGVTNDSSGNGNNGQVFNMSTSTSIVPGKIGQALSFNGSSSYVQTSTALNPSASTVSLWFKLSQNTTGDIMCENSTSYLTARYNSLGRLYVGFSYPTTGTISMFPFAYNTNWHHLVWTWDGSTETAYLDGVQQSLGFPTGMNDCNNASAAQIGGALAGSSYFPGSLDDIRIYNRALSAQEVAELYRTGLGQRSVSLVGPANLNSGLVGWWTFDGKNTDWKTGVTNDSSGSGNNGQLVGMSTTTSVVPGKIGQAMKFDGSSSCVDSGANASINLTGALTLSAWIRPSKSVFYTQVVGKQSTGGAASTLQYALVDYGNSAYQFQVQPVGLSSVYSVRTLNGTIPNNVWTQLTATYDGTGTLVLYVNGVLYTSAASSTISTLNSSSKNLEIGGSNGSKICNEAFYNGSIDDVRVYNRALSAQEVQQLYYMGR